MSSPRFRPSLIAYLIAQAFALPSSALAQTAEATLPEIVVSAPEQDTAATASVGGFNEAPLLETPASVQVFTEQQMEDRGIRSTTDVVRFDASLNEAYNAIGYAEQFSIRGFALDNFASYRKDGLAISSDASIPLENKERIEILKGLAGLQAGIATPGGIVNYVTKRPTDAPMRSATVAASERGTLYGAVDLGGRFEDERFGYRINAAAERLRSYVEGADGERQFVSGAFDWRIAPGTVLALDLDYQHKSQVTAAGYQLIGGTALPTGIDPTVNLNNQPWTRPVETDTGNIGLRLEHRLSDSWKTTLAANWHKLQRDDYAAFPWGCGADGLYPGFCSNGDFDVYDYQSENESKTVVGTQALIQGLVHTGHVQHAVTFGVSSERRKDNYGDCVYGTVRDDCYGSVPNGSSNIYNPRIVDPSDITTGPVILRRDEKEHSFFVQDILSLTNTVKLHAGLRYVTTERSQFNSSGILKRRYDEDHVLPNLALVFTPRSNLSVYGSYSEGLEHGGIAPISTTNRDDVLDPMKSTQYELGFKVNVLSGLDVSAAVFYIKKPNEYSKFSGVDPVWGSNLYEYVSSGDAEHRGLEFTAQGRLTKRVLIGAGLMALDTKTAGTDDPAIEGKTVPNVPDFKSVVYVDYSLAEVEGLSVNGSWNYTSSKVFSPNTLTTAKVPGYHVFGAGLRYVTEVAGQATTLRFNVHNLFDRFYWRDASPLLGGYLLPGAPRTFSLSAQVDF